MANPQAFYTVAALAKETTYGTAVTRTVFLPSEEPRWQPSALRHIVDEGFRGLAAQQYDLIPGPGEGTWQFDGDFYIDSTPNLLQGLLGATDTPSGGSDPYTHALAMAAIPPSYSLEWQQNTQSYLLVGARVGSMKITFSAADGALKYSVQGMSKLGTTTSPTTTSFATTSPMTGWQGTITVAGSSVAAAVIEGEITISRALKPIHGLNNTQDIAALYPGPILVDVRLTIDFSDLIAYNYYATLATATKNAVVLSFIQTASTRLITFTMTKAAWRTVDIERNDLTYQAVCQISPVYNSTDAGPIAVSVKNSQSTGY